MTEYLLFSFRYTAFTNLYLPLLKEAVLFFDKLGSPDPGRSGKLEYSRCRLYRTHWSDTAKDGSILDCVLATALSK
jgi:hypothetical protein